MPYQREFDRTLRIGLIGAGSHTYRNILPTLTFLPVTLAAICDHDIAKARQAASQYGAPGAYENAETMFQSEQLDAVFIAVAPQAHPALAAQAFEFGLHVWMEKPPAMRTSEIDDLIAKRGNQVCVVGFKKAFMPSTQKIIAFFADPANGPVSSLVAQYPVTIPTDGEAVLAEGRYTAWLDHGCHVLSVLQAVGGPVEAVTVHANDHGEGVCVLEFKTGAMGTFHLAHGAGIAAPIERYTFHGKGSTLWIDNGLRVTIHRESPDFRYGETTSYVTDIVPAQVWEPQNAFACLENKAVFTQGIYFEMEHFCHAVLANKAATQGTLEFARDIMWVYESALISHGMRITHS